MNTHFPARPWLIALISVSLLVVRIDGAHLHLCLDGQDSASSVRIGLDVPEKSSTQAPHNDVDYALVGDLLVKPGKGIPDQPPALPAAPSIIAIASSPCAAPAKTAEIVAATFVNLLPPVRGPPLFTTA